MRRAVHCGLTAFFAAALALAATAQPAPKAPATRVVGGHQIDRYDAIERVRQALIKNPNNLTDWVLLGELAQEAAEQVPAGQAASYYRLAHAAYTSALVLDPKNAGLKAAARFAEEHEKQAEKLGQARAQATTSYLEARRRELAQSGHAPTLRTYAPGQPAVVSPQYRTYVGDQGAPYTYQQHYESFFGPAQPRPGEGGITATERAALVKPGALAAPP